MRTITEQIKTLKTLVNNGGQCGGVSCLRCPYYIPDDNLICMLLPNEILTIAERDLSSLLEELIIE